MSRSGLRVSSGPAIRRVDHASSPSIQHCLSNHEPVQGQARQLLLPGSRHPYPDRSRSARSPRPVRLSGRASSGTRAPPCGRTADRSRSSVPGSPARPDKGPGQRTFEAQARRNGIGDQCVFAGAIHDQGMLADYYAQADPFLFRSLYETLVFRAGLYRSLSH